MSCRIRADLFAKAINAWQNKFTPANKHTFEFTQMLSAQYIELDMDFKLHDKLQCWYFYVQFYLL